MAEKVSTREQVKEITERLEAGIQDLFTSEKYRDYLKTMSKFHSYSTRNTVLIHMQMPGATRVAGFRTWQEKFERHVKKGEKGIRILAPTPFTIKKEKQKIDPETHVPLLDRNGNIVTEEVEVSIPRFKPISVFDVLQTEGKPLPELVEDLTGDVRQYEAFMDALRQVSPLPIAFETLPENTDGRCYFGDRIAIREGMSEIQTVSAVIHEITHAQLHDTERERTGSEEAAQPKDRLTEEVEAESVSFAVCQRYGIETGANSFGYLAEWSSGRELPELKASLETIRKTAAALIDGIDGRFSEICRERGIDLTPVENMPEQTAEASAREAQSAPVIPQVQDESKRFIVVPDSGAFFIRDTASDVFHGENGLVIRYTDEAAANETADKLNREELPEQPEAAAPELSDLQQKGLEIARRYESLPLQDRINIIAETFGCKTASIRTTPCTGKWRGTSDICLDLDNGSSLFIGNHRTPEAKTARVQNECVNGTLANYNPEILAEIKTRTIPALLKREAKDNAIAAQKGLKPYTLLNIEMNDGSDKQSSGYLGWYYVTVAVDGKIFALVETGLNYNIARGVLSDSRPDYFVAGALKDNEVDFVFNNVGHSSASSLYKLYLSDNARKRAEKTLNERIAVEITEQQEDFVAVDRPEKQYDLGYGHMGNGLTVWNRLEEKNGDYVTVAHIDPDRSVTFYDKDMPDSVKVRIEDVAHTSNMTVSATQDTPVFSTPAQIAEQVQIAPEDDPPAILPDPAIGLSERDLYGYTYNAMLPLAQDRALELFGQDHTIFLLYPDNTEAMAFEREEIEHYDGIFGIEREEWEASREYQSMSQAAQNSEAAKESALIYGNDPAFGIYQLKGGEELHYHRFASLKQLERDNLSVDRANYELIYTGPLAIRDTQTNLHRIYETFNDDRPEDFTGHSLSVSDIIVLQWRGNVTSHYVDSVGFSKLPSFLGNEKPRQVQDNYTDLLKEHINNHYDAGYLTDTEKGILFSNMDSMNTHMLSLEKSYGTDGAPLDVETDTIDRLFRETLEKSREQAQPTPQEISGPTVAELEAEVKIGKQISLTDLARAVKNEQKTSVSKSKPSILARLQEGKKAALQDKEQSKTAPKRANQLEV